MEGKVVASFSFVQIQWLRFSAKMLRKALAKQIAFCVLSLAFPCKGKEEKSSSAEELKVAMLCERLGFNNPDFEQHLDLRPVPQLE